MAALKETVEDVKFKHLEAAMDDMKDDITEIKNSVGKIMDSMSIMAINSEKESGRITALEKYIDNFQKERRWRIGIYVTSFLALVGIIAVLIELYIKTK